MKNENVFNDTWTDDEESMTKIGDSVKSCKVWYKVCMTDEETLQIDNVSVIYYDVDNRVISIVDENKSAINFHFKEGTVISITKYRQITEKILTGYEKADVKELSSPDFVPKAIYETVTHDPEIVEFCPMVSDMNGYRVLRNTR